MGILAGAKMYKIVTFIFLVSYALAAPSKSNLDFAPLNEFSLQLLDHSYTYQENFGKSNVAISPVSVWNILSLLAEGSAGQTFQELVKHLHLPVVLRETQALHEDISNLLKSDHQDVTLKGQSTMFSDCSLQIHPEFCEAAVFYKTGVYSVDTTNTAKLAQDINKYICLATEGRILNAVREESLENLRLILVDALYFKANWTVPFDSTLTKEEDFYDYQGKTIGRINMMYQKAPHTLVDINQLQAQVLEIPYGKNKDCSMMVLLPFEGTPIKQVLANLASQPFSWIEDLKNDEEPSDIDVYLPRFKISSQSDLIPPLQYSGIQSIFDVQKAELPGVSDSPLFITSVTQTVDLEVTEEGTVAAAAVVVGLEDRFLGNRFEANRNFVFLIMERTRNLIVFAGVYQDPSVV